jgi:ribosomal protein L37AE/L43A
MTTNTNTQTDAPVTINPHLLCHDCNTFMDEMGHGVWACPGCGVKATVQSYAEVIDDDA